MEFTTATRKEINEKISGGSFHSTRVYASVDELTELFGKENIGASGDDKTKHEWFVTNGKEYFSIYDWKEYRNYPNDENIAWHIGSRYGKIEDDKFAELIKSKLRELRQSE